MRQQINDKVADLAALGNAVADGVDEIGESLNLDPGLAATVRGLIATMLTGRLNAQLGNSTLRARKAAVRTAMAAARMFATLAREILKPHLGTQYSQVWDITGFVSSLAISRSVAKMQLLLNGLKSYLTSNAARENAALNVTAAQAELLLAQLQTGVAALNLQKTDAASVRLVRENARKNLRLLLRMVVATLNTKLEPLDDRWLTFGLNKPGAKQKPPTPMGMTAALFGTNGILVKLPVTIRADYHRIWTRMGQDGEWLSMGTTTDRDFIVESLPGNTEVQVAVSAGNNGGESQRGEVVLVMIL